MTAFVREFALAARYAPRLYFAPLVGAIQAVMAEFTQMNERFSRRSSSSSSPR